jgi:apolipoprotein N-acyltransferase
VPRLRLSNASPVATTPAPSPAPQDAPGGPSRPDDSSLPATPTPPRPRARRAWPVRELVASAVSGVALWTAFPPLDLGPIALVALVPLMWAWRDASPRSAALYGFVFGLFFFGPLLEWIRYFGVIAIAPLVLATSAYMAVTGLVVGGLNRLGLRSAWLVAATWVAFEAVRGRWPLGGLPWGEVGVAFHEIPLARDLASWGGVLLVSFFAVACNGLLVDAFYAARRRRWQPLTLAASGLAGIVVITVVGSVFRFDPTPTGEIKFAMLQGNDQNRDLTAAERRSYLPESHFDLAEDLEGDYDVIVFPESSLGGRNPEAEDEQELRERIIDLAEEHDAAVVVNGLVPVRNSYRDYNTNYVYDPDGALQGTYAKQHLVPFGEYVPWRGVLGGIDALERVPTDYKPGSGREMFEIGGRPVGTMICFESAFSAISRAYVQDDAEAIIVTTNNRSYRRSANSAQHLAITQMRAAETGRPILHASISGISGVIDADGNVSSTTGMFDRTVVTGTITTTTGETPYVRYGEWVLWGSVLALVIATAIGFWRRRAGAHRRRS